jgi:hypothetical protein
MLPNSIISGGRMRLNRGCGCLALVLAAINVFVTISVIITIAGGSTQLVIGLVMAVVFVGNVAACVIVGLGSLRRSSIPGSPENGEAETEEVAEDEGEDK